jgi:hypothetical protein
MLLLHRSVVIRPEFNGKIPSRRTNRMVLTAHVDSAARDLGTSFASYIDGLRKTQCGLSGPCTGHQTGIDKRPQQRVGIEPYLVMVRHKWSLLRRIKLHIDLPRHTSVGTHIAPKTNFHGHFTPGKGRHSFQARSLGVPRFQAPRWIDHPQRNREHQAGAEGSSVIPTSQRPETSTLTSKMARLIRLLRSSERSSANLW